MLQSVQFQTFLIAIFMLYRSNAQLAPETDEYENQDENEGLEFRLLQNRVHKTVPSILPIINANLWTGIPCFNLNETSFYSSSSGESIKCICGKATRSQLPVVRDYKTWQCETTSFTGKTTTKPRFSLLGRKTTTKKVVLHRVGTTTARYQFGGVKFSFPTWKPKSTTQRPGSGGENAVGVGGGGDGLGFVEKPYRPPPQQHQQEQLQQKDPGCNYCVLPPGSSSYKCTPAWSYECVDELRRLNTNQRPVQCMEDFWTYNQHTKICHSQDTNQQIYMVIGTIPDSQTSI